MSAFPHLDELFGAAIDRLTADDLRRAIAARVAEDEQLDFKSGVYASGQGADIAADVAAFANHLGGVIILGMTENPRGIAGELTPFDTSADAVDGQVRQACNARIRPFVNGLRVVPVETGNDERCAVIIVPRGRNAPYARVPNKPDGTTLEFPVRDGSTTRWLHEQELGSWYRDRYAARADTAASLSEFHTAASEHLGFDTLGVDARGCWVSVAAMPTTVGHRATGEQARAAEAGFLRTWKARLAPPVHAFNTLDPDRARTALRRTRFSDSGYRLSKATSAYVELAHDGAGFAAQAIRPVTDVAYPAFFDEHAARSAALSFDTIEWALFTDLALLVDHAVDTGADGDLELCARIKAVRSRVVVICAPNRSRDDYSGRLHYVDDNAVPRSTAREAAFTTVTATLPLGGGRDYTAIAVATHQLATDLLAQFGFDRPRLFNAGGWATLDVAGSSLRAPDVASWINANVNVGNASWPAEVRAD